MSINDRVLELLNENRVECQLLSCVLVYDYDYSMSVLHVHHENNSKVIKFYVLKREFLSYLLSFILELLNNLDTFKINKIIFDSTIVIDTHSYEKSMSLEDLKLEDLISHINNIEKNINFGDSLQIEVEIDCIDDDIAYDLYCLSIYFE